MSDFIVEDALIVDRSTLERYASCPAQARLVDAGFAKHAGSAAVSGEEVHKAISATVSAYIDTQGGIGPVDLRQELERNLLQSRPDVQPDAIEAMKASAWSFASFLKDIHYANILRYDGGDGDRCGQLAADLEHHNVRVTAEVDFLHATASPEVLDMHDWKTGRGRWTMDDVADSFQFQCYAWLVLENYPEIEQVRVTIWNTRFNDRTPRVVYHRRDMANYRSRIGTAVAEWLRNKDREPASCVAYPGDACRLCEVAFKCPVADAEPRQLSESVEAYVDQLAAVQAKATSMEKALAAWVDKSGRDIVTQLGNAFGTQKPKANRKPTKSLYSVKSSDSDE